MVGKGEEESEMALDFFHVDMGEGQLGLWDSQVAVQFLSSEKRPEIVDSPIKIMKV
jgi:hypothetical protein